MKHLSRERMERRAEITAERCSALDSVIRERQEHAATATTESDRRVARGLVVIGEWELAHDQRKAAAYLALARGEELQP